METIDLSKLRAALPDAEPYKVLRGVIKSAIDAFSARSDLRISCDHAALAKKLLDGTENPGKELEDILMALTTSSVVFYARATKSQSNHRSTFDLRPIMDAAELCEHEAICKLRDDAIAHYGPGEIGEAFTLRSDHIMLPPPWANFVMVSRHLYTTGGFLDRLIAQSSRATLLMQKIFQEREGRLVEAVNALAEDDTVQKAAESAAVDLGLAIGDKKMAKAILEGPRAGHHRLSSGRRSEFDT